MDEFAGETLASASCSLGVAMELCSYDLDAVLRGGASAPSPTSAAGEQRADAQAAPSAAANPGDVTASKSTGGAGEGAAEAGAAEAASSGPWSQRKCLLPARAMHLFWQLLRGLEHMHAKGIVHRNIKPAQLLIDCHNPDGKMDVDPFSSPPPKAVDSSSSSSSSSSSWLTPSAGGSSETLRICGFSHACMLNSGGGTELRDRSDAGTLWYRAPESLLGLKKTTVACDIWAAGAVWIEMLTGAPVFSGCSSEIGTLMSIFQHKGTPGTCLLPVRVRPCLPA